MEVKFIESEAVSVVGKIVSKFTCEADIVSILGSEAILAANWTFP